MGAASSKNKSTYEEVREVLSENITSQLVSIAQQSASVANTTQTVSIIAKSEEGDVSISGIKQRAVANIDVEQFTRSVTETMLKQIMENSLETAVRDNQEVNHQLTIGGSMTKNESGTVISSSAISRIVNSYSYSQFISDSKSILTTQKVDLSAIARRNVSISNIDQYVRVEMLASQIADAMTKTITNMASKNEAISTKSTSQSSSSGFSLGFAIIAIVIVVILGALAWWFFGGKETVSVYAKGGAGLPFYRDSDDDFDYI